MRALIVIDIQNDFCPNGNLAVSGGDEIVSAINSIMPEYQAVAFTQDWHPADHMSFASNQNATPYSTFEAPYGTQILWPDHCIIGTKGADFHPQLDISKAELVIRKGFRSNIDSYSAFFENDHKTKTGLEGYLRTREISQLDFVGLATDFCVAWSAIDAAKLGFSSRVLLSMTRAIDVEGSLENSISQMKAAGVAIEGSL